MRADASIANEPDTAKTREQTQQNPPEKTQRTHERKHNKHTR